MFLSDTERFFKFHPSPVSRGSDEGKYPTVIDSIWPISISSIINLSTEPLSKHLFELFSKTGFVEMFFPLRLGWQTEIEDYYQLQKNSKFFGYF